MEVRTVKANENVKIAEFGVDAAKEDFSVAQFMEKQKVFKFNDPIQRNADAWSIQKKSMLIVSILEGVHIGEIKAQVIRDNKSKIRNVIDGKQRMTSVRDFRKGKFSLKDAQLIKGEDENGEPILIDVNGLHFDELPDTFRNRIDAYVFEIKLYEINEETKKDLFFRWNNGESLKPAEKRKAKMSFELLQAQYEIKNLPVFQTGISEKQINSNKNGDALLQAMAIIHSENDTGIDSTSINELLDKDAFNDEFIEKTKQVAEYLNNVHDIIEEDYRKESFSIIKTVSLMYAASKAIESGVGAEDFSKRVVEFFNKRYQSSGFASYAFSGTAKKANVVNRTRILVDDIIGKWESKGQMELAM
jgi:hypothetical protein